MAIITYSFVVRDGGVPDTGLTPTITGYRSIPGGSDYSGSAPTVGEVGSGHYYFTVNWDTAPESTLPSNAMAVTIDAGAGISDPNERYITARINRNDDFATEITADVVASLTTEIDDALTNINNGLSSLETGILADIYDTALGVDSNVDTLLVNLNTVHNNTENLSTDINTVGSAVATLDGKVTTIDTNLDDLIVNVDGLGSALGGQGTFLIAADDRDWETYSIDISRKIF